MLVAMAGLLVSTLNARWWFESARFNNEFGARFLTGPSDAFGPSDAAINYLPFVATLLVLAGAIVLFAMKRFRLALMLCLIPALSLLILRPAFWIE